MILLALGAVVVLLFIWLVDKLTFAEAFTPMSESAVLLRQLTTALTMQSMMTTYVFEWSTPEDTRIETAVQIISAPVTTYGFGCMLEDPRDELKIRLGFAVLFPLAVFVIAGFFWGSVSLIKPHLVSYTISTCFLLHYFLFHALSLGEQVL